MFLYYTATLKRNTEAEFLCILWFYISLGTLLKKCNFGWLLFCFLVGWLASWFGSVCVCLFCHLFVCLTYNLFLAAPSGLQLTILLQLPSKCRDYNCAPQNASAFILLTLVSPCSLGCHQGPCWNGRVLLSLSKKKIEEDREQGRTKRESPIWNGFCQRAVCVIKAHQIQSPLHPLEALLWHSSLLPETLSSNTEAHGSRASGSSLKM